MKNQKANTTNYVKALCLSKGVEIVVEGDRRMVFVDSKLDKTFPTFFEALQYATATAGVTGDAQVQAMLQRAHHESKR